MELAGLRSGLDGVDEYRLIATLEKRYRVEAGGAGVEGADVRWQAALVPQPPQDV
jgi:hypothetical protein